MSLDPTITTSTNGSRPIVPNDQTPTCCCTSVFSVLGEKIVSVLSSIGCAITDLGRSILSKIYSMARSLEGRAHVISIEGELDHAENHPIVEEHEPGLETTSVRLPEIDEGAPLSNKIDTFRQRISSIIASNEDVLITMHGLDNSVFIDANYLDEWAKNTAFSISSKVLDADTYLKGLQGITKGLQILIESQPPASLINREKDREKIQQMSQLGKNLADLTKLLGLLK